MIGIKRELNQKATESSSGTKWGTEHRAVKVSLGQRCPCWQLGWVRMRLMSPLEKVITDHCVLGFTFPVTWKDEDGFFLMPFSCSSFPWFWKFCWAAPAFSVASVVLGGSSTLSCELPPFTGWTSSHQGLLTVLFCPVPCLRVVSALYSLHFHMKKCPHYSPA